MRIIQSVPMLLIRQWLALFLLITVATSAVAVPQNAALPFSGGEASLDDQLTIWVPGDDIPEQEILAGLHDEKFLTPPNRYLAQGSTNWIRFTLENPTDVVGAWVLDLQAAMISHAVLFTPLPEGGFAREETGLKFSYESRDVPYHYLAFSLQQKARSTQTYYLRIETPFQVYFSPTLYDHGAFLKAASFNLSLGYLFLGLLLGVFVYLLVLFAGSESRTMVSRFIWFVLSSILVILYVNGYLMAYLPTHEWFTTRLWVIIHVCLQTCFIFTVQDFFQTKTRYPTIHRYFSVCAITAAAFLVGLLVVPYTTLVKAELYFVGQLIIGITLASCFIWWKERGRVALYAIGNIGMTLTGALSTFVALGSFSAGDWVVQHGFEVGLCWQAIFFTWALSIKINELATSGAIAEAESKAKSDFIAKMSHEIRTPMNGVLGMVQLLQTTSITQEQKHYLNVIDGSGKTLLAVINDILDYSKLTAGKIELHPHPFQLEPLLSELNTLFADLAQSKKLAFNIVLSPHVPLELVGDSIRLRQILTNLLANAFKFTQSGMILLKITVEEDFIPHPEESFITLRFSVRDTGIGISDKDLPHLFKNFSQLGWHSERPHQGSGLGLSICKQFVEMMGGTISVHSRYLAGSEFSFTARFQCLKQKMDAPVPEISTEIRLRKVLVAEDHEINRDVISAFLSKLGCQVKIVPHGKAALEALEAEDDFDVVLMDCEMPIMDGFSACQALRKREKILKRDPIPVIALTAHGTKSDLNRCKQVGMNDHLLKPVSLSQLQEALTRNYQ